MTSEEELFSIKFCLIFLFFKYFLKDASVRELSAFHRCHWHERVNYY